MNIVYIARTSIPSRSANSLHIMKMCQALAGNGHSVKLLILSARKNSIESDAAVFDYYDVNDGFSIVRIPVIPVAGRLTYLYSTLCSIFSIRRCISQINPELVHGRDLPGCLISALSGKCVIFESHFPIWKTRLEKVLFSLLIRCTGFNRIVVIAKSLAVEYFSRYKSRLNSTTVQVSPDGADCVTNCEKVEQWPGRPDALQVGYVGHLYKGKGVEVVESVAPKMPETDFHIIGGLEEDIQFWKDKIQVPNVFFHGFIIQKKLTAYINSLDVCLLPNQREVATYGGSGKKVKNISKFTSPIKMFEYMAHKKPIIASDLPVLREVLDDETALLVECDNVDSWVRAIQKLKSSQLRMQYAERSYSLFLNKYTWAKRAEAVLSEF